MIGVDVAKDTLVACCWDALRGGPVWEQRFPNSPGGIAELLSGAPPAAALVLEPTGRYGEGLVKAAQAAGWEVLAAPPQQAKHYLQSLHPRAKCDRLDAQGLAQFGSEIRLPTYQLRTERQEQLWQLLCVRRRVSASIGGFTQQLASLPWMRESLERIVAGLRRQLKELDRQLAQHAAADAQVRRLRQVPGVGPVSAAALALRLQQTPFGSCHQFVAYVGLDLRVSDSGRAQGRRRLSRRGDAQLRWLLYLCAQASVRAKDSPFAEHYHRERAKGLASTQALCAVARKLAKVVWALVRSGQEYDPQRVYARLSLGMALLDAKAVTGRRHPSWRRP